MGHPPRWIIRWGITMIFTIIVLLLVGSWLFKYPDIISSPVVITTENPPAAVVAKTSGKIQEFYVKDQELVHSEQMLAIIENPADEKDVFNLFFTLQAFRSFIKDFDTLDFPQLEGPASLGEIQPFYSTLQKKYREHKSFLRLEYHAKKMAAFRKEIEKLRVHSYRLNRQKKLMLEDLELTAIQLSRDSSLHIKQVISDADYEKSRSRYLQKKQACEQAQINISGVELDISKTEQAILDLDLEFKELKNSNESGLIEAFNNLNSELAKWEQTYILKAPKKGIVSFTRFWSKDQNVSVGDNVITIVPERPGAIIGKMNLTARRSGKVAVGQNVNIKIDNYPYMEFGMLPGKVKSISLVPANNQYIVEIELIEGLVTNYGRSLEFDQEMIGIAEISTEERRLLARIIDPFKYIFKKI